MQKKILPLAISMSMLIALSGCQPEVETPAELNNTQKVEQDNQQPLSIEQSKPAVVTETAIDAKTCLALSKSMQKVDYTSKIEAIYTIQKQLKTCLPTANNAEVLKLLKNYQAMYKRFLASDVDSESDFEIFNNAIYELYYGEGLSSAQLKTLTPRDQYLVGLVNSDADVSIYDEGEGLFSFGHNLKTMADIFTPYLRKDQRLFIQRMAIDNQDTFWSDASVTVSFEELIERTLFWENYIQQYPDGYGIKDAKYLLDFYRYIIFFGADNTQWTDDAVREFIMPEDEKMIQRLSKHPSNVLAKDSQNFLRFLALSDSERQQKYPAPSNDEEDNEYSAWAIVRYQLEEALQIPSIWDEIGNKDCFNGLFCMDENKLW